MFLVFVFSPGETSRKEHCSLLPEGETFKFDECESVLRMREELRERASERERERERERGNLNA